MRRGGRVAAAIEIVAETLGRSRPIAEALKDWGKNHRFAGSADRSAIGNLVYDAVRRKQSLAHALSDDRPRAIVLAALRFTWELGVDAIAELATEPHGPGALSDAELQGLRQPARSEAPWIEGDYPEWLDPSLARVFGAERADQGRALSMRAPLDLRANPIRAKPERVLAMLAKFGAVAGPLTSTCIRIAPPPGEGRLPNVEAEPSHAKGWFEVQDQGSQAAALLCAARAGDQVADICAGAGGKTLAIAAAMDNRGQILAHDSDRLRLRPIFERLKRAGVRNVQVIPADEGSRLEAAGGRMDAVVVDAPCSGSGAWRRKPEGKWRLRQEALGKRIGEQTAVLDRGAGLVRPGGRLVYITCSVLPEENGDQVRSFLDRHRDFELTAFADAWRSAIGPVPPKSADGAADTLLLTPLNHGTDGFFIAILSKRK